MEQKTFIAIDLKSFYASVECADRNLDPLTTNLVVADTTRTEKTICLAVSPSLKAYGIPGRARLFEVVQRVKEVNAQRKLSAPHHTLTGASADAKELAASPELALDYIAAPPQMAKYMEVSTKIYSVYLKHVAPEDIFAYSIDEVFIDATAYLRTYHIPAHDFAMRIIKDVLKTTGITATAGIAPNLFLCKVAMDIEAKHIAPDQDGVRIAELDEASYRRLLWNHRPLSSFWRIGKKTAAKLESLGLYTMGDIARCSLGGERDYYNEALLYKHFGINAELLIDHAWGWEPCTIADVQAYKPSETSLGSGQVLQYPYDFQKAKLIVMEMADLLVLNLVDKGLVTDQIVLTIGYDIENLSNPEIRKKYHGPISTDMYGRQTPKHAHGTANLKMKSSSTKMIMEAVLELFDRIVDPNLLVRRVNIVANKVVEESSVVHNESYEQFDLFTDPEEVIRKQEDEAAALQREKQMQKAILSIKKKYGKNAILKGMNLQEGATTKERNQQIGGHKA